MGDKIKSNNKTTKKQYLNIAKKYYDIERRGKLDSLFKTESGKAYHNINQKVFGSVNKKDPANRVGDKSKNYGNFMGNPADRFPASRDSSGYLERSTERANSGINEYIKGNTLNVKHANNGLSYDYYDSYQANRAKEAQKTENIKTKSEVKKPEVKTPVKTNGGTVQDNEKKEALRKVENKVSRFTKTFKGASGNLYAHDPLTKETRVLDKGSKTWKPATEKEITNIAPYTKWEKGNTNNPSNTTNPNSTPVTPSTTSTTGIPIPKITAKGADTPEDLAKLDEQTKIDFDKNAPRDLQTINDNISKINDKNYKISRAGDALKDSFLVASQYAIGNRALKRLAKVKIPEAQKQGYLQNQRVNFDTDRAINNTGLATSLAINKRNFSDANVAAAMRGGAVSNYTEQGAKINEVERNANAGMKQQSDIANQGTERYNQANIKEKAYAEMQKESELIRGRQAVNMEALQGIQGIIGADAKRAKDRNQMAIDASALGSDYYKRLANTLEGTTGHYLRKGINPNDKLEDLRLTKEDKTSKKNGGLIPKSKISNKLSNIYK